MVTVKCRETDFQIDFSALEKAVTPKTKAVIVNSPNNPSGAVFSEDTVKELAGMLSERSWECRSASFSTRVMGQSIFGSHPGMWRKTIWADMGAILALLMGSNNPWGTSILSL